MQRECDTQREAEAYIRLAEFAEHGEKCEARNGVQEEPGGGGGSQSVRWRDELSFESPRYPIKDEYYRIKLPMKVDQTACYIRLGRTFDGGDWIHTMSMNANTDQGIYLPLNNFHGAAQSNCY